MLNSYNDIMKKDCLTNGNRNHVSVSKAHILCTQNPPINILPKILPANTKPKTTTKNALKNNLCTSGNINCEISKNVSDNEVNIEIHNTHALNTDCSLHRNNSLKIITMQEEKEKKTDDSELKEVRNDVPTNSITLKHPKFSKKSSEIVQELPQLRKTTPRLAKTRSAQNMKLMAQVLGPKGLSSNCNALKSREKNDIDKNIEKISDSPKLVSKIVINFSEIKLTFLRFLYLILG